MQARDAPSPRLVLRGDCEAMCPGGLYRGLLVLLLLCAGCVVKTGSSEGGRPPALTEPEAPASAPDEPSPDPVRDSSTAMVPGPVDDGSAEVPAPIEALRALNRAIDSEDVGALRALIHPEWGVTTGEERFTREDVGSKRLRGLPPAGHRMPERCPEAYVDGEATCTVDDRDGSYGIRFRLDGEAAYLVELSRQ